MGQLAKGRLTERLAHNERPASLANHAKCHAVRITVTGSKLASAPLPPARREMIASDCLIARGRRDRRLSHTGDSRMKANCTRRLIALTIAVAACCTIVGPASAFDCCGCPPCGNRTGLYGCHCFGDCRGTCAYGTCCSGCGDCNPCGGPMCASWRPSPTTECWPGLTNSFACNTSRGFVDGCDCGSSYGGYSSDYIAPVEYSSPAPIEAAPAPCDCDSHAATPRAPGGHRVVRRMPVQQRSAVRSAPVVQHATAIQRGRGRSAEQHRTVSGYMPRATRLQAALPR